MVFLSVGKHLAVSGHIIFLLIFLAGNEQPIHFPPHSPQRFFDKPVSTLIAITTTGSCLATQVRLRKCHTYLMLHQRYLTKRIFFLPSFFWRIEITPHISLDTLQSLQSVVRWAICFIHVLWTSACPDVKNHQAPTGLPPETGCKWTRESRLKTTCQGSPAQDDSFTSSAEVSWEANSPQTEWLTSAMDTFACGVFFCLFVFVMSPLFRLFIVKWKPFTRVQAVWASLRQVVCRPCSFWWILTLLFTLAAGRQVSLSHQRLVPTGGKESDH